MSSLSTSQLEIAHTLFALSAASEFALAGGSALVFHGTIDTAEVDLAVDSPPLFPIEFVNGLPLLAAQDLAARKIRAIIDRAKGRDFTDLDALQKQYGQTDCIT